MSEHFRIIIIVPKSDIYMYIAKSDMYTCSYIRSYVYKINLHSWGTSCKSLLFRSVSCTCSYFNKVNFVCAAISMWSFSANYRIASVGHWVHFPSKDDYRPRLQPHKQLITGYIQELMYVRTCNTQSCKAAMYCQSKVRSYKNL